MGAGCVLPGWGVSVFVVKYGQGFLRFTECLD